MTTEPTDPQAMVPFADLFRVSRRRIIGSLVVGWGALLTACGSPVANSAEAPFIEPAAPVVATGGGNPPAATSSSSDPLAAVVATPNVRQTTVLATTVVSPASTAVPTAVPTDSPTGGATAVPSASPTTVVASSPTAVVAPYDASRLTALLGESITSYAGSVAPRVHNVQLATRNINGAKVAPGATFSFDDRVGDQSQAGGFQVAWGIISNNGVPETVQADAGGICQVATTVFQAAYWAGLPITERYHHLYWIAHYGQPPYGGIGLDATVDFPPVDLQFRNTTSDWIRIDATYDSTHVHVRVVGVDQGWKVTSGTPKVFNTVKVDRATVRRDDATMAPGTQLWVEAAQDGFDVTVERLVKSKQGDLIDRYVFTNHYDPAHNVMVVGSKGITPTAVASGTTTAVPSGTTTAVASGTAVAVASGTTTAVPTSPTSALPATPVPPKATPAPTRLASGQVQVPSLVGMSEATARQTIANLGLQNAATNYQGQGDVPASALNQVTVGAVLSQLPAPGTAVAPGTVINIAVRKS